MEPEIFRYVRANRWRFDGSQKVTAGMQTSGVGRVRSPEDSGGSSAFRRFVGVCAGPEWPS